MVIYNCHTHTRNSPDSVADPRRMSEEAVKRGLSGYAITDHIDTELAGQADSGENPMGSIMDAQEQKKLFPQIKVFSGVELAGAILDCNYEKYILSLNDWDIVMGSVHAVQLPGHTEFFSGIDFSKYSDKLIDEYLTRYFADVEETAETADYDSLSHLTVPLRYIVHKYGRNVNIENYSESIERILKSVIRRNKSLELNTSGYSDKTPFFMPDAEIIKTYMRLGGTDFTIGSDAHIPDNIDCGLKEGAKLLLSLGVSELNYYEKRNKIKYSIKGANEI